MTDEKILAMTPHSAVDIVKKAILLEKRGSSFYRKMGATTTEPVLKDFFEMMAAQETMHAAVLADQLRTIKTQGRFHSDSVRDSNIADVSEAVLTPQVIERLCSAEFEAAAVSAAMAMEEKAIKLYTDWARKAADPEIKRIFEWLAQWEGQHLNILAEMDRQITEAIWHDNRFWPS
jgi:rubrerythrin